MMTAAQIIGCPVDDCGWAHLETMPVVPSGALAQVFGPGVVAVVARNQFHQRIEDVLSAHFATHQAEDYLRTITRLKGELARREAGL